MKNRVPQIGGFELTLVAARRLRLPWMTFTTISQVAFALIVFELNSSMAQSLSAAQALAVSSNGKFAMVYKGEWDTKLDTVSAQAISECKAKGGTDPKIVWSQRSNVKITNPYARNGGSIVSIAHGAIAVSDNGTGIIVGWCFNHPHHNAKKAVLDCQKKGGTECIGCCSLLAHRFSMWGPSLFVSDQMLVQVYCVFANKHRQ
jgi:hypothetical protein